MTFYLDLLDQKTQCSVCWEDFSLDEMVNQLRCEHIFHKDCIKPWLELHATCPVCRKPQNEAATVHSRQVREYVILLLCKPYCGSGPIIISCYYIFLMFRHKMKPHLEKILMSRLAPPIFLGKLHYTIAYDID